MKDWKAPEPTAGATPEQEFDLEWASSRIRAALSKVEAECVRKDQQVYFQVFRAKLLGPILDGAEAVSNREVCERYGIRDEQTVSNIVERVRSRYRRAFRAEVRREVRSDSEADEEIRELFRIISEFPRKKRARRA